MAQVFNEFKKMKIIKENFSCCGDILISFYFIWKREMSKKSLLFTNPGQDSLWSKDYYLLC